MIVSHIVQYKAAVEVAPDAAAAASAVTDSDAMGSACASSFPSESSAMGTSSRASIVSPYDSSIWCTLSLSWYAIIWSCLCALICCARLQKNNVFRSALMGFHHIANWRVGGESAHNSSSLSYISLFGTINIQILNCLDSFLIC